MRTVPRHKRVRSGDSALKAGRWPRYRQRVVPRGAMRTRGTNWVVPREPLKAARPIWGGSFVGGRAVPSRKDERWLNMDNNATRWCAVCAVWFSPLGTDQHRHFMPDDITPVVPQGQGMTSPPPEAGEAPGLTKAQQRIQRKAERKAVRDEEKAARKEFRAKQKLAQEWTDVDDAQPPTALKATRKGLLHIRQNEAQPTPPGEGPAFASPAAPQKVKLSRAKKKALARQEQQHRAREV